MNDHKHGHKTRFEQLSLHLNLILLLNENPRIETQVKGVKFLIYSHSCEMSPQIVELLGAQVMSS
jgi:hypothetical protein